MGLADTCSPKSGGVKIVLCQASTVGKEPLNGLGVDPVAEGVGLQLDLGQDGGIIEVENQFDDPLLLCEMGNDPGPIHSSFGPRVGPESGLSSIGLDSDLVSGLADFAKSNVTKVNFGDTLVQPGMDPPVGFTWQISEGVWVIFPIIVGSEIIEWQSEEKISSNLECDWCQNLKGISRSCYQAFRVRVRIVLLIHLWDPR